MPVEILTPQSLPNAVAVTVINSFLNQILNESFITPKLTDPDLVRKLNATIHSRVTFMETTSAFVQFMISGGLLDRETFDDRLKFHEADVAQSLIKERGESESLVHIESLSGLVRTLLTRLDLPDAPELRGFTSQTNINFSHSN